MTDGPTLLDIFAKQVELSTQLAVIHEQLKSLPDHETRLRALERFRFTLVGVACLVPAGVSALGTWLGIVLTRR